MNKSLTVIAGTRDSTNHWITSIRAAWQKSVESIIETGQLLNEAKAALKHGMFIAMVETQLPFGKRAAQCLMAVADHPLLSKAQHVALLPPSWGTLYQLTKLDDETLVTALENGSIRPSMERKDVAELRGERKQQRKTSKRRPRTMPFERCIAEVSRVIRDALDDIPGEQWDALIQELHNELEYLKQHIQKKRDENGHNSPH